MKKTVLVLLLFSLLLPLLSVPAAAVDYPSVYQGFLSNIENLSINTELGYTYWDSFMADLNNDSIPELVILYGNGSNCTGYTYTYVNGRVDRAQYTFYSTASTRSGANTAIINSAYGRTQVMTTTWARDTATTNGARTETITNTVELLELLPEGKQSLIRSFSVKYVNAMSDGVWANNSTTVVDSANPDVSSMNSDDAEKIEENLRGGLDIVISAEDFVFNTDLRKNGTELDRFLSKFTHKLKVVLNSKLMEFDQDPIIDNGRTLVPLRAIFEGLQATVSWDESTQTITSTKGDTTIIMQIGSHTFTKNGTPIELDVPPQIFGERTLVPVRAISESLGATVGWDEATMTVTINL